MKRYRTRPTVIIFIKHLTLKARLPTQDPSLLAWYCHLLGDFLFQEIAILSNLILVYFGIVVKGQHKKRTVLYVAQQ